MTYRNGIFHNHRKTEPVFLQLEMFDVCTTGNTAHIDTIFRFLPHTRQHGCIMFLFIHSYRLAVEMWTTMKNNFLKKKKFLSCSFYLYMFRKYVSYDFPIINFCNPGVLYETPCISIIYCSCYMKLVSLHFRNSFNVFVTFFEKNYFSVA
jgi:hypothetical protein